MKIRTFVVAVVLVLFGAATAVAAPNQASSANASIKVTEEGDWVAQSFSMGASSGHHVTMQTDGNLVVYAPSGRARWQSGTAGNQGATFVLQRDGNMVVYGSTGRALWQSGTPNNPVSENTVLTLAMQADGNLVWYRTTPSGSKTLWQSGTAGR